MGSRTLLLMRKSSEHRSSRFWKQVILVDGHQSMRAIRKTSAGLFCRPSLKGGQTFLALSIRSFHYRRYRGLIQSHVFVHFSFHSCSPTLLCFAAPFSKVAVWGIRSILHSFPGAASDASK